MYFSINSKSMNEQSYNNIKNAIKELENELKVLENIPKKINSIEQEIIIVEEEITELEAKKYFYSQGQLRFFHKFRKNLSSKRRGLENTLEALKSFNANDEISKKQKNVNSLLNSLKLFEKNERKTISDRIPIIGSSCIELIFPEWGNISFFDEYVEIKINHHYRKFRVEQSRKYLDNIKHYYSFRNIPKLEVVVFGTEIKEIKNIEILFYHIDFLTIVGHSFETESFEITKLKRYDKAYFLKFLPFVFTKNSLSFLCEICDENFPIIPMPELIIGRNETKVIQDSFLFKCNNKLIWESIEHSKASYVFEFNNFDEDAQRLFDYITHEKIINKRQKLIHSYELKKELMFYKRIYHNNFYEWKNEITSAIEF